MTERWLKCVAVALVCLVGMSGCCGMDRVYRGDCNSVILSGRNGVGGCADGSCGGCAGGQCGAGVCGGSRCCVQPLRSFWNLLTCSSGCGEFYFNEWINDPPDRCDPCDDHGSYIGPRSCERQWTLSARMGACICGHDCGGACAAGGSCACGEAGCSDCQHAPAMSAPEGIVPEAMEPTPARTATRPDTDYYTPPTKVTMQRRPTRAVQSRTVRASHQASVPRAAASRAVRPAAR
jgi:hypothetical protein